MEVVITGLGCRTPLGDDPDTLFEALCAGRSAIRGTGPFPGRGPVAALPGGPHLSSALAEPAVRQALGGLDPAAVGLVGASTSGDMVRGQPAYQAWLERGELGPDLLWAQLADRPTERVARALGFGGPRLTVSTACTSGAVAVGIAADWVASGRVRAAVAFGADALCGLTVHGFGALGAISDRPCQPFDAERTGLSLGEGAAALLLESAEHAAARGAIPLARVAGWATRTDAHHLTAPDPEGAGARAALREAGLQDVGWVCAHGTATPLNDAMEAAALQELLPGVPVSSLKGALGHTLGAAGSIELLVAVCALVRQVLPPNTGCVRPGFPLDLVHEARAVRDLRAVLSVNFAFGGHNAAVRLRR